MRATQLIIGSLTLPHVSNDRYSCWAEELKEQKVMISGRMVEEVRGIVQRITWSSDYLDPETKDAILAALRGGKALSVTYLPDTGEMAAGTFLVESITPPTFLFSDVDGTPVWHGLGFALREVSPHA